MDKSTHEGHLSQPLQTNNSQLKMEVTFLTGYNGIFEVTIKNKNIYFAVSVNDDDFSVISFPCGAYGIESLDDEITQIPIKDCYFKTKD